MPKSSVPFEDRLLDWVFEGEYTHVRAHLNVANKLFARRANPYDRMSNSSGENAVNTTNAPSVQGSQGVTPQRKKPGPAPGSHRRTKSYNATEPAVQAQSNLPDSPLSQEPPPPVHMDPEYDRQEEFVGFIGDNRSL